MATAPRFKLYLRSLKFLSAVDNPAQPEALALLCKREGADEIAFTARVVKLQPKQNLIFGWAWKSTIDGEAHHDLQGDQVVEENDDFLEAACKFMLDAAPVDEMHNGVSDGSRVVFAWPLTPELAKTFSIETPDTGLMVGVKVTPEVMAKFADGTYKGWSIAGSGTREPLEKRDTDATIAKLKADAEADAQKLTAEKLYVERVQKEMHDWCDVMAASHGYEVAKSIAEKNRDSVGKWGTSWLAAHPAPAVEVEKADDLIAFIKSAGDELEKANAAHDAYVATFAKSKRIGVPTALVMLHNDPTWRDLAEKQNAALEKRRTPPSSSVAKAAQATIDKITTLQEAAAEQFAVAHNVTVAAASARLLDISPAYKAAETKLSDAYAARAAETSNASQRLRNAEGELAESSEQKRHTADLAAKQAAETPTEKALRIYVEQYQVTEKLSSYETALHKATRDDEVARALYDAAASSGRMPSEIHR